MQPPYILGSIEIWSQTNLINPYTNYHLGFCSKKFNFYADMYYRLLCLWIILSYLLILKELELNYNFTLSELTVCVMFPYSKAVICEKIKILFWLSLTIEPDKFIFKKKHNNNYKKGEECTLGQYIKNIV